jgi:tetratricopeptide (TPR) repeat protein
MGSDGGVGAWHERRPERAGPSARSLAQKGEVAATGARIVELSRAGKYAEAIPLAQGQLENLEKKYGPFNSDVAGALNNLALLNADQGRDAEAEPLYKRAVAIMEKVRGLDSAEVAPELNILAALYQRFERYAIATFDRIKADPKIGRAEALRGLR